MQLQKIVFALSIWVGSIACAQTAPAADDPEETRLAVGNDSEYQSLLEEIELDAPTKARVQEQIDLRRQRLADFVGGERGKRLESLRESLRQARLAKDNERVSALRRDIQPLVDEYWQLRNQTRRDILRQLSTEQLTSYVGLVLSQRVSRPLMRIELNETQRLKIRAAADARVVGFVTPELLTSDPFFRGLDPLLPDLRREVFDAVLTPQQRVALRGARGAVDPATQPATRP